MEKYRHKVEYKTREPVISAYINYGDRYLCENCGSEINRKVKDFSNNKYGKSLCIKRQQLTKGVPKYIFKFQKFVARFQHVY